MPLNLPKEERFRDNQASTPCLGVFILYYSHANDIQNQFSQKFGRERVKERERNAKNNDNLREKARPKKKPML